MTNGFGIVFFLNKEISELCCVELELATPIHYSLGAVTTANLFSVRP